jgi:hypothetical protein
MTVGGAKTRYFLLFLDLNTLSVFPLLVYFWPFWFMASRSITHNWAHNTTAWFERKPDLFLGAHFMAL